MTQGRAKGIQIPLGGQIVESHWVGGELTITIQDRTRYVVRAGRTSGVKEFGQLVRFIDRGSTLADSLGGADVSGCTVGSEGDLEMTLADGRVVFVGVDADVEAWEIEASDGRFWVALPGGGVSEWGVGQ